MSLLTSALCPRTAFSLLLRLPLLLLLPLPPTAADNTRLGLRPVCLPRPLIPPRRYFATTTNNFIFLATQSLSACTFSFVLNAVEDICPLSPPAVHSELWLVLRHLTRPTPVSNHWRRVGVATQSGQGSHTLLLPLLSSHNPRHTPVKVTPTAVRSLPNLKSPPLKMYFLLPNLQSAPAKISFPSLNCFILIPHFAAFFILFFPVHFSCHPSTFIM